MAPALSTEQKCKVVEWYFETKSPVTVQRKFRKEYKCRDAPGRQAIMDFVKQFRSTGCVKGKKKGGSEARVRTAEVVENVRTRLVDSPTKKSVRRLSIEEGLSYTTTWRILRKDLHLFPYKIHVYQELTDTGRQKRQQFAMEFGAEMEANQDIVDNLWVSDEAFFHLSGDVNKHNVRFWGSQHPHEIQKSPLHPRKVMAWCAISKRGIIGPFFFEGTVTSQVYLNMLETFFIPELRRRRIPLRHQWFQQDGARPHTTNEVLDFLNQKFGNRVISNRFPDRFGGGFLWPPTSPDLNPCDFYLWGFLKDSVFTTAPRTLDQLRQSIVDCCTLVDAEILDKVMNNFTIRLRAVQNVRGGHIEHIIKTFPRE